MRDEMDPIESAMQKQGAKPCDFDNKAMVICDSICDECLMKGLFDDQTTT